MHQAKFSGGEAHHGFEFGLSMGKTSCSRLMLESVRAWCAERIFGPSHKDEESDGMWQAAAAG